MVEDPEIPGLETPESVKLLGWLTRWGRSNWEALVKPPVLTSIVIFFGLGYFASRYQAIERHDLDHEHISFLQDQITAYKDRLQGATPDEAAKRFSTLE